MNRIERVDHLLSPVERGIFTKMRAKVAIKTAINIEEKPLEWKQTNQHEKDALSYSMFLNSPSSPSSPSPVDQIIERLVKADDDRLKRNVLNVITTSDLLAEIHRRITDRSD